MDNNYPIITDTLIKCLVRDFPDVMPRNELSQFEYGRLAGIQVVIDKLKAEKEYNEQEATEEDE